MGGFSLANWTLLEPSSAVQAYKKDFPCMGGAVLMENFDREASLILSAVHPPERPRSGSRENCHSGQGQSIIE